MPASLGTLLSWQRLWMHLDDPAGLTVPGWGLRAGTRKQKGDSSQGHLPPSASGSSGAHLPSGPWVSWPVPVSDAMCLCGCRAEGVFPAGIFELAHSAGSGLERAGNYTSRSQRPQPLQGLCSEQLEVATLPCDLDADVCSHSDVHVVTRI